MSSLAWSGPAAGLSMGLSFVTRAILHHHLPDTPWRPLVATLGYSSVASSSSLKTTLTVILPLLTRKSARVLIGVLQHWTIVLLANLLGGLIFVCALAKTGAFDTDLHRRFDELASQATSHPFGVTILRATFAGWLIALMVWPLPAADKPASGASS